MVLEDRPVTSPMLLLMVKVGAGEPVTVQDSTVEPPVARLAGEARKLAIEGEVEVEAGGGGLIMEVTVTVTDLVAIPPGPVAVKV